MGSLPHKDYRWHTEHRGKQCMFVPAKQGRGMHVDVCVSKQRMGEGESQSVHSENFHPECLLLAGMNPEYFI